MKTLCSALHDLHVLQRARYSEDEALQRKLYTRPTAEHQAVVAVKLRAAHHKLKKETNGYTDLLKESHADRLTQAQACF